jgi:hypothetical protein
MKRAFRAVDIVTAIDVGIGVVLLVVSLTLAHRSHMTLPGIAFILVFAAAPSVTRLWSGWLAGFEPSTS